MSRSAKLITKGAIDLQKKLRKAKRALKLADSIMEYCGGDAWEREATEEDRKKFYKLYDEIMGVKTNAH